MEYKINVPENCDLIVTREGTIAIIEVVPREPEFKENDIVTTTVDDVDYVSIVKSFTNNLLKIKIINKI